MGDSALEDCQMVDEAPKSISCTRIPEEFLNKSVAVDHFSQFGRIRNFTLRPRKYSCIVEYETADEAENALLEAGVYNDEEFDVDYTKKATPKTKMADYIDPDVQDELEAMSNTSKKPVFGLNRFGASNMPAPQNKTDFRSAKLTRPAFSMENAPASLPSTSQIRSLPADGIEDPPPVLSTVGKTTKNELEAILRKPALTPEEKCMVLDARDKLIRLLTIKNTDIKRAASIKGVCPDMCPEKERYSREAKRRVEVFEMDENDSKSQMNHQIAVKEYSRSSADQETPLPHELRPEPVLKQTMTYLLQNIMDLCDDSETSICDWYHFLWDRTRSIRKDITQQELCSPGTVLLVEQCARFHIHCAARCVAEEPQVFDQKINTENLTKCLQSLKYMYHDLGIKMIRCPNEAEFRAYVVLLNLHDSNFLWEVKQLPEQILRSPDIQFAIKVYLALESNNYVKFFALVRSTTYLNACILLRYFTQVRVRALRIMFKAYVPRNPIYMSIENLAYLLGFEDYEQCAQFLEYYGLNCDRDQDKVLFDRSAFCQPDLPYIMERAINVVEHKRHSTVGEAVHGAPLDTKSILDKYDPHDSFDENGILLQKAWLAKDQNYYKPEARIEARNEKSTNIPFKEDDNIFKIPTALPPSSPRSSPKSRLSPKTVTTTESSSFSTNTNNAFPATTTTTAFGGFTNVTSSEPTKTSDSIFKIAAKPAPTKDNNIFGGFAKASQPQTNLFATAATSFTPQQQSKPFDSADGQSFKSVAPSNAFFKPVASDTTQSTSNSIFSSGFSRKPESGGSLFSQVPPVPSNQSTSIFGSGAASNQPSNIFGSFASSNAKQQPSAGGFSFQTAKPTTTAPNLFGGFANSNKNSVMSGITSLAQTDNNKSLFMQSNDQKSSEELKLRQNLLEMQQKQKEMEELERKRKAALEEQERQRKLEEERKELERIENERKEIERKENERRRLEQKRIEIEQAAANMTTDLIDELVASNLCDLIKEEIERYRAIEEMVFRIYTEIMQEVTDVETEQIASEIKAAWDKNILEKYFIIWRSVTRKAIEQRRKIANTPVWLPSKPMNETIPELRHPLQNQTLSLMKRYRSGLPRKLIAPPIREDTIDLWKIITPELQKICGRHKQSGTLITTNIYWKCIISVPDIDEDPSCKTINHWLNNIFVRQLSKFPRCNDTFFVEQNDANGQRLNVCLRKLSGSKMITESQKNHEQKDIEGANAIMFFFTPKNLHATRARLKSVLKAIELNDATGLIIYNLGKNHVDDVKETLQLSECMDYEKMESCVFANDSHRRSGENLCHLTKLSLQYVAANSFYDDQLEMQQTISFLRICLADELWQRIYLSSRRNLTLVEATAKLSFLKDYHNEAIDRLISVCTPSIDTPTLFPYELRKFVPQHQLDIPLQLEYFPENWNIHAEKHQQQVVKFLESLRIRKTIHLENVTDIATLETEIFKFVYAHIASEHEAKRTTYKILEQVLAYIRSNQLDPIAFKEKLSTYIWLNSFPIFTTDLLSFQYQQFVKEKQLPDYVIYDKDEYLDYTRSAWWLQLNEGLLKRLTVSVRNNIDLEIDEFEQSRKRQRLEETVIAEADKHELEDTLAKASAVLAAADKKLADLNKIHNICKDVSKDFDLALYRQERELREMKDMWKSIAN